MWKPEDKESKDERLVFVKAAKRREFLGLQKQNDEQSESNKTHLFWIFAKAAIRREFWGFAKQNDERGESNKTLPFLNFCEAEI